MLDRHLYLIGMPGCGKSSLGRRAARETGLPFMDTDEMIAGWTGMTIPELFREYGEEAFRRAETRALSWLSGRRPSLVATGGGLPMKEENRRIMRSGGTILLIDRPLEDIAGDIRTEGRPLLAEDAAARLRALYEERMPVYRELADLTLRNDRDVRASAQRLTRLLRERYGV